VLILPFRERECSAAASKNDADPPLLFKSEFLRTKMSVSQCLLRSAHGQAGNPRDVLAFLDREKLVRIDSSNFPGDLDRKRCGVKTFDSSNPAARVAESIPKGVAGITERSETPKAADDDPVGARSAG
jgi:hypothetical protein